MEESEEEEEVPWKIFFSHPLFSCIITFYSLILLYFPQFFLPILLSPVLLLTGALLFSLLLLGSTRYSDSQPGKGSGIDENKEDRESPSHENTEESEWSSCKSDSDMGFDQNSSFFDNFVEWNVRAPLEVIHEAYDEEEEDDNDDFDDDSVASEKDATRYRGMEKFPSLSLCYPESDSDSSESDFPAINGWVSPEKERLRWEEDDGEGLIEIRLEDHNKKKQIEYDFHAEEDNLIEIDLSPFHKHTSIYK